MHWNTPGYEGFELSTQLVIGEALKRGHAVDVLDPLANFIRIKGMGKVEYIRQATRTSADTYVSSLIMENKKVTKAVLREAGIRVPSGMDYTDLEAARAGFPLWKDASVVIKPNTTNFGIAVSMLPAPIDEQEYIRAMESAFREDEAVLVEELIEGKEYRFLVIGRTVRAVLHRVAANVTGDGRRTIAELVALKNADPLRGTGYTSPLEKIRMGVEEEENLRVQGMSFQSVPREGLAVFLRKNSNISTGGDSIDFTDTVHHGYKDIAAAAAASVGALICGVDMIVQDVESAPTADNYGVIELNYNPALHIHDFPYRGKNRGVEKHVLDLLEL
jgi:glutamate--cysteine ligase